MNPPEILKQVAACLAVTGLCLPPSLLAATADGPAPGVIDVELRPGGVLLGQVVDPQGIPKANVQATLLSGGKPLAETRTDHGGFFALEGLRGGVYQLTAADGTGAYRVWAPGTAPPSSQPAALVVAGMDLMRGQPGGGIFRNFGTWMRFQLANPLVLAAITATAIAVPVAVHNANRGGPKSPP